VAALLDELDRLVESRGDAIFHDFIPRNTPGESLLRATLLPLLEQSTGGTGVAGRLAGFGLSVSIEGDGTLLPAQAPLCELTPGRIQSDFKDFAHG
jgi:hypothetical protein